jgi:hypothetical protein
MTPATALAANAAHAPHSGASGTTGPSRRQDLATDPVFAAIKRHRQAVQAWQVAPSETHEDDKISNQLLSVERAAWCAWLTTPPTTRAGVIATLEHASQQPYPDDLDDHVPTNLAEAAECLGDAQTAGEAFPQMIATALRKLV